MSDPKPFQGRIPIDGHVEPTLSAFAETDWDIMSATIPGQSPAAYSETAWDTMNDNAEEQVMFAIIVEYDWDV